MPNRTSTQERPIARDERQERQERQDQQERPERVDKYGRPIQPKTNNTPKFIFAASGLFFVMIAIIVVFYEKSTIDAPTNRTIGKLGRFQLPAAPQFPGNPTSGSANAKYKEAIQYFIDNHEALNPGEQTYTNDRAKFKYAQKLTQLLIEAADMEASQPFFDDHIVISLTDKTNVIKEEAITLGLGTIPVYVVQRMAEEKNEKAIYDTVRAIYVLGQRQFTMGRMLPIKDFGLENMNNAIDLMIGHFGQGEKHAGLVNDLREFKKDVEKARSFYNNKKRVLQDATPHVGDLLNIALNDEEYCFRLEAVRRMGLAKWNPRTLGNRGMIDSIIEKASQSSDGFMKQAAQTALNLTKDEFHRQR